MNPPSEHDFLRNLLLRAAFCVIGFAGAAFGGYVSRSINDHETRVQAIERAVVAINTKLEIVLADIEYHHRQGEVKVQH